MIFILFHELSHLKNLTKYKYDKLSGKKILEKFKKEPGQYIERQVFRTIIADKIELVDEYVAKKITEL